MLTTMVRKARMRRLHRQGGFTLVELLIVIAILAALAAIVLLNVSGVNSSSKCAALKTDGATLQGAADLYFNTYSVYPVGTTFTVLPGPADAAAPAAATSVNVAELLAANFLHSAPPASETFTYNGATPTGTVHGVAGACTYN
jgi:prepilin-type N-terminal cleavage/methylation domain-containing protein